MPTPTRKKLFKPSKWWPQNGFQLGAYFKFWFLVFWKLNVSRIFIFKISAAILIGKMQSFKFHQKKFRSQKKFQCDQIWRNSPLWHKLRCLWQFYEVLFSIRQKLLPTWVNFMHNWEIFHGSKWANYENYKSHLVTQIVLFPLYFCFIKMGHPRILFR